MILASDSIFTTIQGEGKLTGVTSLFIRLAGCNLHCTWHTPLGNVECDTSYAAYRLSDTTQLSVQEILDTIKEKRKGANHIVITGGEPLLQAVQLTELCKELKRQGFHITIETNGTLFNRELFTYVDLYSISPKLQSSTPLHPSIAEIHNSRRVNIKILTSLIESAKVNNSEIQLKFVVTGRKDIEEVEKIISLLPYIKSEDILIMPVGSDTETLSNTTSAILDTIIERGWRFCDRLHIRLFGNTPGR